MSTATSPPPRHAIGIVRVSGVKAVRATASHRPRKSASASAPGRWTRTPGPLDLGGSEEEGRVSLHGDFSGRYGRRVDPGRGSRCPPHPRTSETASSGRRCPRHPTSDCDAPTCTRSPATRPGARGTARIWCSTPACTAGKPTASRRPGTARGGSTRSTKRCIGSAAFPYRQGSIGSRPRPARAPPAPSDRVAMRRLCRAPQLPAGRRRSTRRAARGSCAGAAGRVGPAGRLRRAGP